MITTPYQPPAPNSATAMNPFLNLGLSAYQNAMQPFNPQYLDKLSGSLYDQANYNFNTNLLPSLNSGAITAGGYGGDRAQIAKGVVMDRLGQNVTNAMAPLYAQGYESSLNRGLQAGQYAANTGSNLEQFDLNRLRDIGMLNLDQQRVNNQTAQLAMQAAGVPQYTNPIAAGIGGFGTLYTLLNSILGNR